MPTMMLMASHRPSGPRPEEPELEEEAIASPFSEHPRNDDCGVLYKENAAIGERRAVRPTCEMPIKTHTSALRLDARPHSFFCGNTHRSTCRPRNNPNTGKIAHASQGSHTDISNRTRLPHNNEQPTRVMVPLNPTSSLTSWYSSVLARRRSTLRRAASSNSRQRISSCHETCGRAVPSVVAV